MRASHTAVERYKLFSYIENNKEIAEKLTSEGLAQQASNFLGFDVTKHQAADARLQLGIRKQAEKSHSHDRLRIVVKHLQGLYTALGLPMPEDLVKIRAGQSI